MLGMKLKEELFGRPERVVPLIVLSLASIVGLLCRSWSVFVAAWVAGSLAWRYWSARLVIDDLGLGPVVLRCPPGEHSEVWLTFDDGPGPDTLSIVQQLNQRRMRATFFFIGEQVERYHQIDLLREALEEGGHSVANHTFSHPNLLRQSEADIRTEIVATEAILRAYFPTLKVPLFRPPFGYRNRFVLDYAQELGLTTVGWTCNSLDFLDGPAERVSQRVASHCQEGTIILLHDGREERLRTVAALPALLDAVENKGLGAYSPR